MSYHAYALPGVPESDLELDVLEFENKYGKVKLQVPKLERKILESCFESLYSSRKVLRRKPFHDILDVLYNHTELWLNSNFEFRKMAEEMIPITTGLSPPMIHKVLDDMMSNFRKDLYKMTIPEKGSDLELIVCISEVIPGPQVLSTVKSLANKSAVFCKSPSTEPIFSSLYFQSFADVDENIARCVATTTWKGGNPEYRDLENFVYGERTKKEAIIAFGRGETIEAIKEKANPNTKFIPYDRGVSLGVIGKEILTRDSIDEVAFKAALAVCMDDQRACFSSQLYYIENGGEISPLEFSEILAKKMQELEFKIPRGDLPLDASATFTELMKTYELLDLTGFLKLYEIRKDKAQTGGVIYKKDKEFEFSPSYRVVKVKPVDNVLEVPELVKPISNNLHTVGVALDEERKNKLTDELVKLGARVTPIDKMYQPSILEYDLFN